LQVGLPAKPAGHQERNILPGRSLAKFIDQRSDLVPLCEGQSPVVRRELAGSAPQQGLRLIRGQWLLARHEGGICRDEDNQPIEAGGREEQTGLTLARSLGRPRQRAGEAVSFSNYAWRFFGTGANPVHNLA